MLRSGIDLDFVGHDRLLGDIHKFSMHRTLCIHAIGIDPFTEREPPSGELEHTRGIPFPAAGIMPQKSSGDA
jgi:hypothetical protein